MFNNNSNGPYADPNLYDNLRFEFILSKKDFERVRKQFPLRPMLLVKRLKDVTDEEETWQKARENWHRKPMEQFEDNRLNSEAANYYHNCIVLAGLWSRTAYGPYAEIGISSEHVTIGGVTYIAEIPRETLAYYENFVTEEAHQAFQTNEEKIRTLACLLAKSANPPPHIIDEAFKEILGKRFKEEWKKYSWFKNSFEYDERRRLALERWLKEGPVEKRFLWNNDPNHPLRIAARAIREKLYVPVPEIREAARLLQLAIDGKAVMIPSIPQEVLKAQDQWDQWNTAILKTEGDNNDGRNTNQQRKKRGRTPRRTEPT